MSLYLGTLSIFYCYRLQYLDQETKPELSKITTNILHTICLAITLHGTVDFLYFYTNYI